MVRKFWGKSKAEGSGRGDSPERKEKSHAKAQRRKGSESARLVVATF